MIILSLVNFTITINKYYIKHKLTLYYSKMQFSNWQRRSIWARDIGTIPLEWHEPSIASSCSAAVTVAAVAGVSSVTVACPSSCDRHWESDGEDYDANGYADQGHYERGLPQTSGGTRIVSGLTGCHSCRRNEYCEFKIGRNKSDECHHEALKCDRCDGSKLIKN